MHKPRPGLHSALLALTLLCMGGGRDARGLLIDDFTTPQTLGVSSPATQVDDQTAGAGILGGERDISLTRHSGSGLSATASAGSLTYSQDPGAEGSGLIVWDGADADIALDPAGLGGVDFTEGGIMDAIGMTILASNAPATLTFAAYTDAANFSIASVSLPAGIPPAPQSTLIIPFADFAVLGGVGADFSDVGAFWMFIDGTTVAGLGAGIGAISTTASDAAPVPEPGTGMLLALGLLALGVRERRSPASRFRR